jgi:type IV pilus assembly protein PilC
MPTYTYTAKTKAGDFAKGTVAAPDRTAATASLVEKGLVPVLVKETKSRGSGRGFSIPFFPKGGKVGLKDKVIFSRQFATMINAGVPITQSLNILKEQATVPSFRDAIADISSKVEGGSSLAGALAEHPDIFSPVYINMVKAGEAGGILDEILDRLATQQEKDAEIVSKVKGAMTYPAVIFFATMVAFVFLMTVIVPKLAVIFEGMGAKLPIYTRILLFISNSLVHYGIFIGIGLIAAGISLARYTRTPIGKRQLDTLLLKLPIFGPILVKVNVARFARTFGSLMSSGISVLDSLTVTASALNNTVFQDGLNKIAAEVKNGKSVSEPLKELKVFPLIVGQMIAVGEETGQMDTILLKVAGFYESEVDTVISSITSIIEPILIITLGGMVGFIVISVFGPISSLSNSV